jgi:DNA-binding MarR family transcriptional regulator
VFVTRLTTPEPETSTAAGTGPDAPLEPVHDRDVLTLAWISRVLERSCADITLPQYRLLALVTQGDERASDLAERLALARPTVSATVDTLVERNFLERTAVDGDRRAVKLTLTYEGRHAMQVAECGMRERLDEMLTFVDDPDLVTNAFEQLSVAMHANAVARSTERSA